MIIFFVILALLTIKPYLSSNFPYTHDGENHLARFANYKLALKEGQFPPRFAPNLLNHYGYPVFNYNYPLANILSLPFSILKINYETTFKILIFGFVVFGFFGANLWLKSFHFSAKNRAFTLLALAFSPYLANILYFRGNIGELMALMIFPWLLWLIETASLDPLLKKPWSLICQTGLWTMFFLSHNVMVLLGTPVLIGYAFFKHRSELTKKVRLWFGFGTGLLLSLWFWLPAVVEKNLIILENADLSQGYLQHFPTFNQLLFSPLQFGFSLPGSVDTLSFQIGLTTIFTLLVGLIMFKKLAASQKLFLTLGWLFFILQLAPTQWVWSVTPFANFIQFPWRLSFLVLIFSLPLLAWLIKHQGFWTKLWLAILIIGQMISVLKLKPADYFHKDSLTYDLYPASTSTANENLPQNFTFEYFGDSDWQPTAEIIDGNGSVIVEKWHGSKRQYLLNLTSPATIIEPTANFAGWETRANGQLIDYIDSAAIGGRIAYTLPAGQYQIKTTFTQNTRARQIGNWASLLTLFTLLASAIYLQLHAKKRD